MSATVRELKRAELWKTIATVCSPLPGASYSTGSPPMSIAPLSGFSSPIMWRRRTLFPVPLFPSMTTVSPGSISRSTPRSTWFWPKDFVSPDILTPTGVEFRYPRRPFPVRLLPRPAVPSPPFPPLSFTISPCSGISN